MSSAGSRAHHTSRLSRSGAHIRTTTARARWPCMSSLVDVGRADIPRGAVGTAWRVQLLRDRGPPGTSRSRMTGRVSSSEDAARTTSRCSRSSRGVSLQCAYRAPRLGISTQGPVRGHASHGSRWWARFRALKVRRDPNAVSCRADPRRAPLKDELSWALPPKSARNPRPSCPAYPLRLGPSPGFFAGRRLAGVAPRARRDAFNAYGVEV